MKMSLKRVGALVLALAVCLSCVLAGSIFASADKAADVAVSIEGANIAHDADSVSISVKLDKNPGLIQIGVKVEAPEGFSLTKKVYKGDTFLKYYDSDEEKNFVADDGSPKVDATKNPFPLTCSNDTSTGNFTGTGVLWTLTYSIDHDKVEAGKDYTFKLVSTGKADAFMNVTMTKLTAGFTDGTVKIAACPHTNTEIRDKVNPSCSEDGYTGDTYCKDCGKKIADGQIVVATAAHVDVDGKWETDGTYHWHTCKCGAEFDKVAHSGGTATCKDKAKCSICQAEYGNIDPENHVGKTEVRDKVNPSCSQDGYTGDTYCLDCGNKIADGTTDPATGEHVDADDKWESDGTYHWHTCGCGTEFDKVAHSGGTATCKDKAKCSICQAEYGNKDAHNHAGGTEIRDDVDYTCDTDGYSGDTYCLGCGAKIADGEVLPAAHRPGEWIEETKHTCTEDGEEAQYCTECTTELGRRPVAAAHTAGEWVVTKAATETEKGSESLHCSECGEVMDTREIPPTVKSGDNSNLAYAVFALTIAFGGLTLVLAKKAKAN